MKTHRFSITKPILALGILGAFAMKPARKGRVSFDKFEDYDFAHRGLHNREAGIVENTLPAFERAVEKGFGIELRKSCSL